MVLPLCVSVSLYGLATVEVYAQEKPRNSIEEVVVTARLKSESLQEVPLDIKPFSGETLERRDFVNLEDIAGATAGLSYAGGSTSGYQESPTIRGLRQGFLQDRVQNVATLLNGIYLQRQSMANVGLVDMERIEVVKGPQNSLYGRNAFAGAINYVTKKPEEEFSGYGLTTQGNNDRQDYRATVTGPIWENRLLGRASYGQSQFDGHTENKHPFADAESQGWSDGGSDKQLGGNDDSTYNLALTFMATDTLVLDAAYFNTSLKREGQPSYIINGVKEVASQQTTPFSDMNFNPVKLSTVSRDSAGLDAIATGNTLWRGDLDLNPGPGTWVGSTTTAGVQDQDWGYGKGVIAPDGRIIGAVDPRNKGFTADTSIYSFSANWEFSENWSTLYTFGYVDHEGGTGGPAERDPLYGSYIYDVSPSANNTDAYVQTNALSERPHVKTKSASHELRFDWAGTDFVAASFGAFYSNVQDEQYDQTIFMPICTTADRLVDQDQDPSVGCYLPKDPAFSPLNDQIVNQPFWSFARDQWNGAEASKTEYTDDIYSVFGTLELHFTPDLTLRLEGRYTREDKEIQRESDLWGIAPGGSVTSAAGLGDITFNSEICAPNTPPSNGCIPYKDDDKWDYFTPKVGVEWSVTDDNFLYAYAAKGLKSGGFNNTSVKSQETFDEETNWTYEIGSKNTLFDGALQLNMAVYYVDWSDVQGSEAPQIDNAAPNANVVTGNIGDVKNYGVDLDGIWLITEAFSIDFGFAYTNPKYDDDVQYDSAERYYYYQCTPENLLTDTNVDGSPIGGNFDDIIDPGELCGNTDIGGNELQKVSKYQANWGLNYAHLFDNGWDLNARLDGNYQSKQWIDLMNEGYIPARTIWNTSINLSAGEHWEFTLWSKNVFDKDYISGSFTLALFNKYIVTYGAERTYGATAKYMF